MNLDGTARGLQLINVNFVTRVNSNQITHKLVAFFATRENTLAAKVDTLVGIVIRVEPQIRYEVELNVETKSSRPHNR